MSGIQINRKEIEACEEAVKDFRVNELHQLVAQFKYPKIGKKQELVNRAVTILNNPKYQLQAVQKVREIQTSIRVREATLPYPMQNSGTSQQQQANGNNVMHQQHNPYHQNMNPGNMPAAAMPNPYNGFLNATAFANLAAYGHHFAGAQQVQHGFGHQMHHLNQSQQVIPNMQHSAGGIVKNLRTVELPFYDLVKVVIPMTELPSYTVPTRPGEGRFACQFGVATEDIPKLTYQENAELPRYELQMRVFLLETTEEQQDAFPPGSVVRLDDFVVNLPPVIPTNKPNAEQKRYPRSVNLTPYCRPARSRERPHRLNFEWNGDKRAWAFTVLLVRRLNSDILLKRMRQNPQATRPFERTKETIIRRLNGADEDDVQMDSLKISLIDPLMRTRMKIPARAVDCTHLQSFDLNNYLMMNEKRPGWKCPVCDKNAIYSKLIVDEYFERMLKEVSSSVEEVELLRNGAWRLAQANNAVSLDTDEEQEGNMVDEDEDIMIVEKPAKGDKKKTAAELAPKTEGEDGGAVPIKEQHPKYRPPAPPKEKDVDIICLSSDDEDEQLASAIAASNMQGRSPSNSGTPNSGTSGGANVQNTSGSRSVTTNVANTGHGSEVQVQQKNGHNNGSIGSALAPLPILQTNGQQPIFRPVMDNLAKTQVAQHLALFLQSVYSKNNQYPAQNSTTATANNH